MPLKQMYENPKLYCVLHTVPRLQTHDGKLPLGMYGRVSWVNPMHPRYFLPKDLPTFPRPTLAPDETLRICTKTNLPVGSLYFLKYAMEHVGYRKGGTPTIRAEVLLMGGHGIFSKVASFLGATYAREVHEPDYYDFNRAMARCHVLVPLLHPFDNAQYFPLPGSERRLSGYVSQAIAHRVPLLLHEDLHDIYQEHLTARAWVYPAGNATDRERFVDAFKRMLAELGGGRRAEEPPPPLREKRGKGKGKGGKALRVAIAASPREGRIGGKSSDGPGRR